MLSRRLARVIVRTSAPSIRTAPPVASCSRGISANAVDLPPPDGPTSATVVPGQRLERQACQAGAAIGIDEAHIVEPHMAAAGGSGTASGASSIVGRSSMMVKTRTMPARPSCNAAFSVPRARSGRAAISNAATKPVKSPRRGR